MAKERKYRVVPDDDVRQIWQCTNDDCDEQPCVAVKPGQHQSGGIPRCLTCDRELTYVRTEVIA